MTGHSTSQQPAAATDALRPAEIAQRIETVSVERAALTTRKLIVLGVLGGIYIGLGGALATLALTDNGLGFGLARLSAGVAFSLGLILLVIAGGELFTGNNLMVLAMASRKVSAHSVWRNWSLAYVANAAGALLLALTIHHTGILEGGGVKATAARIAEAKVELGLLPAFSSGRFLQRVGVPGGLAQRVSVQRRRQSDSHHLAHQCFRRARLRALCREPIPSSHWHAERSQRHVCRNPRQHRARHPRQYCRRGRLGDRLLAYLSE